jgi:hypothetical protein
MVGDCELELRSDGYVHVRYAPFAPWRSKRFGTKAAALLFRVHPDDLASERVAQRQRVHLAGIEIAALRH